MWFMKTIVNPLMRLILKSPLHGIFSASVLLLSYRGRKSGREYSLPVEYAREGDAVYILPGMPEKKTWWRNLRGGAAVELVLRGERVRGNAVVLQDEQDEAAMMAGLRSYFRRFPISAQRRQICSEADGSYGEEDLRQVAKSTILVQVKLDSESKKVPRPAKN
jgi:deazaflavin-dependent oxidoreductase (nitroreductase family)